MNNTYSGRLGFTWIPGRGIIDDHGASMIKGKTIFKNLG